jgi:hypothetical protein
MSAQVLNAYYAAAKNLADKNLKFALHQIIDNHTEYMYLSSHTDVWDILKETAILLVICSSCTLQ